jgi:hypothetical protein
LTPTNGKTLGRASEKVAGDVSMILPQIKTALQKLIKPVK